MRKLTQGFGRAIRRPDDSAVVWVLDPRFPLPPSITGDVARRIYSTGSFGRLKDAIPKRFRLGRFGPYERARLVAEMIDKANAA